MHTSYFFKIVYRHPCLVLGLDTFYFILLFSISFFPFPSSPHLVFYTPTTPSPPPHPRFTSPFPHFSSLLFTTPFTLLPSLLYPTTPVPTPSLPHFSQLLLYFSSHSLYYSSQSLYYSSLSLYYSSQSHYFYLLLLSTILHY